MLFSGTLNKTTSGPSPVDKNSLRLRMLFLASYVKPQKKVLALSVTLSGFSIALGMVQPYFSKILIDHVFIAKNAQLLWPVLGILLLLLVIGFVIRVINSYIYTRYSARILFAMREDLFNHLQKIPLSYFSKQKIGDMYSRIASDMADIQALATDIIPQFLFNFLTCLITAGILIWMNWKMALLSFAFTPVALIVIYRLKPTLLDLGRNVAQTNADISHFLFESLSNTRVIRAFGAQGVEHQKLGEKHSRILKYLLRYQILGAVSGVVPTVFVIFNSLVVFGYGGYLVLDGTLTIGTLVAFSVYQGRVFGPLRGLMEGFLAVQKSRVALARVGEILDILPIDENKDGVVIEEGRLRGDIVFDHVGFAYDDACVFKDICFHVPAGQITALVGPSGAGKTTICHLAANLMKPDTGIIMLDGVDISKIKSRWFRKQIAMVSQDIFLFHTSILENIRFSKPDASMEQVVAAAKSACIHAFIENLPNGYLTEVGDQGVRLSGGQKQRISIARAVLLNPKILILDEATAFLDVDTEDLLKTTLHTLMENKTILIVSHRFSAIDHADKIIALDSRGIIYDGPPKGFADDGQYRHYR